MCTVSALVQYGMERISDDQWNYQSYQIFYELIKKAEEFDRISGQPDCLDPVKDDWMKRINERLECIEKTIR